MRIARVNISLPDDLYAEAKARGWNISRMTMQAIRAELERDDKIRAFDEYLAELDAELGPPTAEELAAAERWVDRILSSPPVKRRPPKASA